MSYNYGQGGYGQSNPYGSSNPYGRSDPYAQSNPYSQQQQTQTQPSYGSQQGRGYGAQPERGYGASQQQQQGYAAQQNPRYGAPNQDVEMTQMNGAQGGHGLQHAGAYNATGGGYGGDTHGGESGPNILDETRRINEGTEEIERNLGRLENAQRRALNDTITDRTSPTVREIEMLNTEIMSQYRNLLDKMKRIKKLPTAGSPMNEKHIGLADRRLQASRQKFMEVESAYQRRMREQTERQYRTAYPTASEDEVRQACEEPNQQVFAQALMNRDRRGESRQVLGNVRDRHEAIQKIERQMIELAELFQDMERMVVEQEPMVEQIETGAVETNQNIQKGNTELSGGIEKARAARKKKWICFWICVAIFIVIAIVAVVVGVILSNQAKK